MDVTLKLSVFMSWREPTFESLQEASIFSARPLSSKGNASFHWLVRSILYRWRWTLNI